MLKYHSHLAAFILFFSSFVFGQDWNDSISEVQIKNSLEFDSWKGNNYFVRDGLDLAKVNFSSLDSSHRFSKENDFALYKSKSDELWIKHRKSWRTKEGGFLEITISYLNSGVEAHEYVIDQYFLSSTLSNEEKILALDKPTIFGDISFYNGRLFILNNIVVDIYAEGHFKSEIMQVGKEIEEILLTKGVFDSPENIKPRVELDTFGKMRLIKP